MADGSAPTSHRGLRDTSSRCVTDSVTGRHDFVVANYSLLDRHLRVGQYVSSTVFTVGGYDWTLRFYPDGSRADERCWGVTSAYLSICNVERGASVAASYTLSLLDKDGNASSLGRCKSPPYTYRALRNNSHGFEWFFPKPLLRFTRCLNNDCLTIRCVLTVLTHRAEDTTTSPDAEVPPPELPGQLERMLKDGRGADVTFDVGGRTYRAHRFLLATRSPVFNAELFGPMMEKDTQCIKIADMEPAIFEMLLHFIYTDSLPGNGSEGFSIATMQHLLVAADRYWLDRLKLMCEGKLCKSIDVKTVTSTLALADQHHCKRLKDACLAFMSSPEVLSAVLATDGFEHLMASCPLVLNESNLDNSTRYPSRGTSPSERMKSF